MAVDPYWLQQQMQNPAAGVSGVAAPVAPPSSGGGFGRGLGAIGNALFPTGGMDPQQASMMRQQALLNMGLGMMAAGSQPGATFGGALGQGLLGATNQYQASMQNAFQNSIRRQQQEREEQRFEREEKLFDRQERVADRVERQQAALTAGKLATGMQSNAQNMPAYWQMVASSPDVQSAIGQLGLEPPTELDPQSWEQFRQQLQAAGDIAVLDPMKGQTADIQNWRFRQSLTPEQQKEFSAMQRQPTAPQIIEMGGRKWLVDRMQQTATPLNTLADETAAQAAIAEAKAKGQITGTVAGEIQKKGSTASQVMQVLDLADPLIDLATGSLIGKKADQVASVFGKSLSGAEAIAQLKILQTNLVLSMPRMEGPQSNFDAQLYVEAAGSLGDPTVPREQKKAALTTIRQLQKKYEERAGVQQPMQQQAPSSAVEYLRANPQLKEQFRSKYGYLPEGM